MRELGSRIALHVTGAAKGRAFGKFWDRTAYSRIVSWGRDLRYVLAYIARNQWLGLREFAFAGDVIQLCSSPIVGEMDR